MPPFARGLKLGIVDRDRFDTYMENHAHDPAVYRESWGANEVPAEIYVVDYDEDEHGDNPFYRCIDLHVNGEISTNYWNASLLNEMIDAGALENTGEYDVEFVEQNI